MSSLPHLPQLDSFSEASLMAAALTVVTFILICPRFSPPSCPAKAGHPVVAECRCLAFTGWPACAGDDGLCVARARDLQIHLVAALEHQDLARLVGGRDLQAQPLDDLARLGDLL